jgi:nitrogen regulatory protein P-II 1
MEFRKIIAIMHVNSLEAVEAALKHAGVVEVAITRVKGYGDYKNFYSPEWVSEQARVEVFVPREQAASVVEAICTAAYAGLVTDGMVAVLPVETLVRIRDSRSGAES